MANQLFANNATTTTRGSTSTTATTIVVNSSSGFPNPTAGDFFVATLDGGGNYNEIVKVTAVAGNTWTVIRAQENTTAKLWQPNSRIECRITAGTLGVLGPNGSSDNISFIQSGPGTVTRTAQDKMRERVTVFDFMTGAQVADVLSATPVLDHTTAIEAALNSGAKHVIALAGRYRYSGNGLNIPQGVIFEGEGIDYWDTFRPDPVNALKRDSSGTHIYFVGTGNKNKTIQNMSNYHTPKTVGGNTFPFTDFTLDDSVNGSPATPRPISVGVILNKSSQIKNMRLLPSFNLLAGYNDPALLTLADDWDVGLWVRGGVDCLAYNVQVVGYWRTAAIFQTENDGTYTQLGNGERSNITKCFGQGRRGLLIRNAPQIPVVSNTTTTITIRTNSTNRITAQNQFKIGGSSTVYTFSGFTMSGSDLQLTGVSPNLPGGVSVVRSPSSQNGVSASVYNDCLFTSLDHTSGNPSSFFGIGEATALEADGYPLRAIAFKNTKCQTTYDHSSILFGDIRDWKFDNACQWENGAMIAYSNSEDVAYTEDLRMDGEFGGSFDITAFNPREAWLPFLQIPTQFTDGSFVLRPWRSTQPLLIQDFEGNNLLEGRVDNTIRLRNGTGFQYLQSNGSTNDLITSANNTTIGDTAGSAVANFFGTSKNTVFFGAVSPNTTGTQNLGSASVRWNQAYINAPIFAPAASVTPANNGDMVFQLTSNTQLTIKVKGSDAVVRSVNLTLA